MQKRASGVVCHITSLPSPYGIGTLGREAYAFCDFLVRAKQRYWQVLPLGPTAYGDSPYQSPSAFAGNPYLIDLRTLINEGLLLAEEAETDWGGDPALVDFGKIYENRFRVLRCAFLRGRSRDLAEQDAFYTENRAWLTDYALFAALKTHFGMRPWNEWDADIRTRQPEAMARCRALLSEEIAFQSYLQYLFFRQWNALRTYVASRGVKIIGDVPIYVPYDSADVWEAPENYLLDASLLPTAVAGVPPDYFSRTGQLWGNPIYNWARMAEDGYAWWIRRIGAARRLYDVVRIDHFRGLASYWAVPFGEDTAISGEWKKGPGIALVGALKSAYPGMDIIAEDLGFKTPEVEKLLADSGFPGMRVIEFAFDPLANSEHLPHNVPENCIFYASSHDNPTLTDWIDSFNPHDVGFAVDYLGLNEREGLPFGLIRGVLQSPARLALTQIQDYLGLGAEARMNTPSVAQDNWRFRLWPGALTEGLADRIAYYTQMFGRA